MCSAMFTLEKKLFHLQGVWKNDQPNWRNDWPPRVDVSRLTSRLTAAVAMPTDRSTHPTHPHVQPLQNLNPHLHKTTFSLHNVVWSFFVLLLSVCSVCVLVLVCTVCVWVCRGCVPMCAQVCTHVQVCVHADTLWWCFYLVFFFAT